MIYSEAGGVTKTTTAVSLAMTAAATHNVTLIDLDPRAAATQWIGITPEQSWQTIDAIIADENPEGWVADLAITSPWSERLKVVPSSRQLSTREQNIEPHADLRLLTALEGVEDLVIIDCPNRQGGILTQNALAASDYVVYAARANQDGIDGIEGGRQSVARFIASREKIKAPVPLQELGIVVGDVTDTIMPKVAKVALSDLGELDIPILGIAPRRTVVDQVRMTGDWYGNFDKGKVVAQAYSDIFDTITRRITQDA